MPLALLCVCGAELVWRARRSTKKYGRSPIRLFQSGRTVQNIREIRVVGLGLVLVWQALAAGFGFYVPLAVLLFAPWPKLGVAVFAAGMALVAAAIADMGPSWQMGFDQTVPEHGLVKTGVFRLSRNPIYLGLLVLFIGWLLVLPTMLSLIIVVGVALGVRRQAIDEEEYLQRTYGPEFRVWAREVGRFVPWLGRLR
jgi:protein-S-isoprenylcysteine O-methyltransferase Ste14